MLKIPRHLVRRSSLFKFAAFLIDHRKTVYIIFAILTVVSAVLIPFTVTNYDLAEYLPDHYMTKRAITVIEDEFGYPDVAYLLMDNKSVPEILNIKNEIKSLKNVKGVLWLDDVADIYQPLEAIPESTRERYFKGGSALLTIQLPKALEKTELDATIISIEKISGENSHLSGEAKSNMDMRNLVSAEVTQIAIIVVPICILILVLASASYIEPFLYLGVIGISIALNMGSNALFNSVSFITFSLAGILQLALSLDYSLFLFHRFKEELSNGADPKTAICLAVKNSLGSISASAATTIAGFLSLMFMQYGLGSDLGVVLAKGIIMSFITVMILLPPIIYTTHKLTQKTAHKPLVPKLGGLGKFVVKGRYVALIILVLLMIPSFLASQQTQMLYGDNAGADTESEEAITRNRIAHEFGEGMNIVILVEGNDPAKEQLLVADLEKIEHISRVTSIVNIVDPALPISLYPKSVVDNFVGSAHNRILVSTTLTGESEAMYKMVDEIDVVCQKHYPDAWLSAGKSTSLSDIKSSISTDAMMVTLFSALAVGLIILLTFKSVFIPVLLLAIIQTSIWINVGLPYFADQPIIYIGYLVVSSIQMGATIDYAILIANRYMEFRKLYPPKMSAVEAMKNSGMSVLISGGILTIAGFIETAVSRVPSIQAIGLMLGRGAALSLILVILLLPGLLVLFDKPIRLLTLKSGMKKFEKDSYSLTESEVSDV